MRIWPVVFILVLAAGAAWPQEARSPAPVRLSLRQAMSLAVENSPELEDFRSRIREARYRVDEAYTQVNPRVDFAATYTRNEPPVAFSTGGRQVVISQADNYNLTLTIRQAIFTFGRLKFSALAAELRELAAKESYRNEVERLIETVAADYFNVLLAQDAVVVTQDNVEAREARVAESELLFEQGQVARFDVLRNRTALSEARQQAIEAADALRVTEIRLLTRLGLDPENELELEPVDLVEFPDIPLSQARDRALELRPELQSLRLAAESARARVEAVRADDNPRLDLQSAASNRNVTGFSPANQIVTSVVFSIPIFDGGLTRARVGQALEAVVQLEQSLESTRRQVLLDVEQSYRQMRDQWAQIGVAEGTVEEAEEALRVAELRYASGVSTNVELLDSQAAYNRARLELARARSDYLTSRWHWWKAISGEYPVEVPLPPDLPLKPIPGAAAP
ncbi:MAG: TolC family protein [Armatimonadetes bacterium]|nr:TolC family protein [Armatimonadota bacterium]